MTNGAVVLGRPALSASTMTAIQRRVAPRAGLAAAAARAGQSLVRPRWSKFIPYIGLAITAYQGYGAFMAGYNETEVDWEKMEQGLYDAEDLAVFRTGYRETRAAFSGSTAGVEADRARQKVILIPSQAMPMIAVVDLQGIALHGRVLTWDPAGAPARRRAAISGRGPAGPITLADGTTVRGSWEEYPFAVTRGPRPIRAHTDRVPLIENWIQGGFITAANREQTFIPGDTVHVHIL